MFFYASKILWPLVSPGNLLLLLLCAGAGLLLTRWRRAGRRIVLIVAVAALAVATMPLGQWMTATLEQQFPPPSALPAAVDGIIVLGGFINPRISEARGQVTLNDGGERLTATLALARRYPSARLVFTAGSGSLKRPDLKEATYARRLFADLSVPRQRIVYEDRSRNTFENALFSKRLVEPKPGQVWLLVTSAFHMPRAVGCFRRVGWEVIPYPVDYRTAGMPRWWPPGFDLVGGLRLVRDATHEWLGLLAYRLAGRTDRLLPAPRS